MESEFKLCFGTGVSTVWKKMKKTLSDTILFNFKGLLEYPEATLKYAKVFHFHSKNYIFNTVSVTIHPIILLLQKIMYVYSSN